MSKRRKGGCLGRGTLSEERNSTDRPLSGTWRGKISTKGMSKASLRKKRNMSGGSVLREELRGGHPMQLFISEKQRLASHGDILKREFKGNYSEGGRRGGGKENCPKITPKKERTQRRS